MSNSVPPYDLVVLGGGSGGLAAAKRAALHGAKVAMVEADRVGGTCVIRGCIPKKLMVYASELSKGFELAPGFGFLEARAGTHSWEALAKRRNNVVSSLESMHERYLSEHGVTLLRGRASLESKGKIRVGANTIVAKDILIATGSTPRLPSFPGSDLVSTSDGMWELTACPRNVVVLGGGYIATEYASFLSGLGANVTLVARSEILRTFDCGLRHWATTHLRQRGVTIYEHAEVREVLQTGSSSFNVCIQHDNQELKLGSDLTLFGTLGRIPNTAGLNLDGVGVDTDEHHGGILVDDHHATSVPGIFALGDVLGRAQLTPLAIRAGRSLADRLFADIEVPVNYDMVPTAIFTSPPIGTVGLSEHEAAEKYGDDVEIFETNFGGLKYSFTDKAKTPRTFMKLVRQRSTDRVLGVHIAGDDAAEMIQGFAVALTAGATKSQFDATLAIHPSSAEELVLLKNGRDANV